MLRETGSMSQIDDFLNGKAAPQQQSSQIDSFLGPDKPTGGAVSDALKSFKSGVEQLPGMATGIADLLPALAFNARPFTKAADAIGEATGFQPGKWAKEIQYSPNEQAAQQDSQQVYKPFEDAVADPTKSKSDALSALATSAPDIAKFYATHPLHTVNQAIQSVPAMLAGGALSKLAMGAGALAGVAADPVAGIAARAAVPGILERSIAARLTGKDVAERAANIASEVTGGAGEGLMQTGQQMDQGSDLPDQRKNAIAALGSGLIDAGISSAGGHAAHALGLETPETLMAKGLQNRTQAVGGIARNVIGGALSEGALQELPQSMQEQVWQNYAEGKPLMDGVVQQGIEGGLAGGLMGAGANIRGHGGEHAPAPEQAPGTPPEAPPLALGNTPDPLISFRDGSVARQSEVDAYLNSLPEDQRSAARAKLMGLAAQPADIGTSPGAADPNAPQREAAASPQALDATTAPGAAPDGGNGVDFTREFDTSGLSLDQRTPSQRMGIYPTDGPLSNVAAMAVDSGAHAQLQQAQAEQAAADAAKKQRPSKNQEQPNVSNAGPLESAVPGVGEPGGNDAGAGLRTANTGGVNGGRGDATGAGPLALSDTRTGVAPANPAISDSPLTPSNFSGTKDAFAAIQASKQAVQPQGVTSEPQAPKAQQSITQPAQAGGAATAGPAASAAAGQPATAGGRGVQAAGMTSKRALYDAYKATGYPDDVVAASVLKVQEKADALGAPVSVWRGAGGTIGVVPASQSSPFKGGELIATVHPNAASAKHPQEKAAPAQNDGAQATPAPAAQAAPTTPQDRNPNWRKNSIQAGRVARELGLEPKGKRLAQIVAEVDAKDARGPVPEQNQPAPIDKPVEPVHLGRNQTPLSEGGKPFATKAAATDAKKQQPMMRVVKVKGGFALADKSPAQLAAEAKAAKRLSRASTSAAGEPIPAHAFIAGAGGLSQDVRSDLGVDGNPRIGNRTLFAGRGRGMSIEDATNKLIEDGYLSQGASHNDAYALIKRSLSQPQYNADGIERIAEAESAAQFEDYLASEQEAADDSDFDPFVSDGTNGFIDDDFDASGYAAASDPIKTEVRALVAQANALGIDTDDILEQAHEDTRNESEQAYYERARTELTRVISESTGGRSNQEANGNAQGKAGQDAGREIGGDSRQADGAQGASVAAGARERFGLAAPSRADVVARQNEQEAAAKQKAKDDAKAEADAKKERDRKDIAARQDASAENFVLGQDANDSLSGQGAMFSRTPEKAQAKAVDAQRKRDENFARWSNNAPLVTSAQAPTYDFKSGEKIVVEAFHGAKRPDRIGGVFDPKRATSGPMAFFTSEPALASSYATNKTDTSLANEDQSFETWFRYKPKGQRAEVDIARAWYSLTQEQKATIAERMPDIRMDDDGNIIYEKGGGDIGSYAWELKQTQRGYDKQGNPLKAAVETWLNSGSLFNDELEFVKVLKLAGFPVQDVRTDFPTDEFPSVFKTFISMQKPLVVSDMPVEVRAALEQKAKADRTRAQVGADNWDKRSRTLREWVYHLNGKNGADSAYAWTSIPDKVTDVLKSFGYDGIVDWSGKGGGHQHPVYIPFASTQVKGAFNRGTYDPAKKDINFSREQSVSRPDSNARNVATQMLVDGLTEKWTRVPEIIVARNMDDPQIPQDVREEDARLKSQGSDGEARGFIYRGKVYLLSDQLKGPEQIAETLFHEVLGHYGLRGTFGEGLTPILQQLGTMRRKDVLAKAREYGLYDKDKLGGISPKQASDAQIWAAMSAKDRLSAAEEVLAEMAQTQPTIGFVKRAIALIRNWLRANVPGFKSLRLTDADIIQAYILPARGFVTRSNETPQQSIERAMMAFSRTATDQTQTKVFKRWFAGSRVVDADGKPLVMYHGTPRSFDVFSNQGRMGRDAIYLTPDPEFANRYAGGEWEMGDGSGTPNVMPVYVSATKVFDYQDAAAVDALARHISDYMDGVKDPAHYAEKLKGGDWGLIESPAAQVWIKKNYPDGFYVQEAGVKNIAVFRPEQIKSATGNSGTFDPANPDIRFSRTSHIESSMGEMTPAQEAAYKNVAGVQKVPTTKERIASFKANLGLKMKQALVDQFAPIQDVSQQAYMLARMSKGSDGATEALLLYGKPYLRDGVLDVNIKDGGFAKVLASLKGEHDRFFMWVAAQRAERLKAEGKENLMGDEDITALRSLNAGKMADGTVRMPIYAKALQELNAFNEASLKVAMESGLIDQAAYDLMKDQPYVPFYRLMEEQGGMTGPRFSSGLTNQKAWKKLKGGTQQLNADLMQNALLNWSHLYAAAARNRAALATMDAAEGMGVAYKVGSETKGAVKVMRDGITEHWMIEDPYLLEAVSALNYSASPLMKPLSSIKKLLTWGVTVGPAFKIRNLIRDSIAAVAQSPLGYNPMANIAQGLKLTATDSQVYASMLASGGIIKFGTQENSERLREQVAKLGGVMLDKDGLHQFTSKLKGLYEAYQEIGDRTENVNRAALYDQLIKKGYNHADASFMARDLMDFSMSGSHPAVRFLTQTVPFLNARLQGLYKLGRSAKEDPKKFAAVVGAVSLASLGLLAAYSDDEDWKKREDWDRDSYWWFKIGDTAYRIPKPFEVGAIGTLAERTAELMFDKEMTNKRFMDRIGFMVGQTFSFDPTPQAIKPLLDIYANKDSFTQRSIESQADQRLRPQDRYNERTSEVARMLGSLGLPDPGQLVKGDYAALSPKQVDYLLHGYFSWVATAAATVSDFGLRPVMDRGERPDLRLKDVFLAGNFVESLPTGSSRYVTQLYDQAKSIEQAYASYREAIKQGDTEKALSIKESAGDKLRKRMAYANATQQLSNINSQAKSIEANRLIPGDVKRARLTELELRRDKIARRVAELT